jgi:uncharacterized protein YegJ (DUF2314 family)
MRQWRAEYPALALLALLSACGPSTPKTPEQIAAEREDAAFEADLKTAIAEARAHLPFFWEHKKDYDANPVADAREYDFMLRIALDRRDGEKGFERIWVEAVGEDGAGKLSGFVATSPLHLGDLRRGDRLVFAEKQIVDWSFVQGRGLLGHYTTRVELPRMDLERAGNLRATLLENPQ